MCWCASVVDVSCAEQLFLEVGIERLNCVVGLNLRIVGMGMWMDEVEMAFSRALGMGMGWRG